MNDTDLERQLRAQHGPREDGYAPTHLPMSLEEAQAARPGPSGWVRATMFVGAAAAGVLAVAVAGAILSGPGSDGVGGTNDGSPSPGASSASGASLCTADDVVFAAEPWGGAAGSRGTIVTASLADGRDSCGYTPPPFARITDADGAVLVIDESPRDTLLVNLRPGDASSFAVEWSNWCGSVPAAPVTLSVRYLGWSDYVPVSVPAGGDDPVPPCSGSNAPSALSVSSMEPAP